MKKFTTDPNGIVMVGSDFVIVEDNTGAVNKYPLKLDLGKLWVSVNGLVIVLPAIFQHVK